MGKLTELNCGLPKRKIQQTTTPRETRVGKTLVTEWQMSPRSKSAEQERAGVVKSLRRSNICIPGLAKVRETDKMQKFKE
jgi:hypothetical protein